MNLKGRKGMSTGQSKEHQRDWSESSWKEALATGNFDRAREHLNFEIVGGKIQPVDKSKSIGQRLAENLAARGIKDPNEGLEEPKFRTIGDFMFSGTHERMVEMAFGDQPVVIEKGNNLSNLGIKRCPEIEQWALDIYNFVAGKYGEQNIVSFYVHLDETTPHAHVAVVPVNEKNKVSFKQIFAGKNKNEYKERMRQLHSDLAVVNRRWGLQRGTSLTDGKSRGLQTFDYRRQLEDDSREKELALAEMEEQLSAARHNLKVAGTRIKGLQTMISRQEEKKALLEKELKELQRRLRNNEGDNEALEKQMEEVQKKLQDTEEMLADKREKLADAEEKLLAAREAEKALSRQNSEMQRSVDSLSKDAFAADGIHLRLAMLDQVIAEYRQMVAALPASQPSPLEGSTLELVAEHGIEVLYCARLLAFGLVDDATTFAQGHGGGGGGSDMKWGRDDDEDDKRWRRRCVSMACRMMKPTGRSRKR